MPETMKLFDNTKKIIGKKKKKKNRENVPSLEVAEVVWVRYF